MTGVGIAGGTSAPRQRAAATGPVGHLNWAYLKAPWGHPDVAGFVDNARRVNRAAECCEGFVWRAALEDRDLLPLHDLVTETGGRFDPDRMAATLSVWTSAGALRRFVQGTIHGRFLARRAEWFVPRPRPSYVIWPVERGHRPTIAEARAALDRLEAHGPSAMAYQFSWCDEPAEAEE